MQDTISVIEYGHNVIRIPNVTNATFAGILSEWLSRHDDLEVRCISDNDFYGHVVVLKRVGAP